MIQDGLYSEDGFWGWIGGGVYNWPNFSSSLRRAQLNVVLNWRKLCFDISRTFNGELNFVMKAMFSFDRGSNMFSSKGDYLVAITVVVWSLYSWPFAAPRFQIPQIFILSKQQKRKLRAAAVYCDAVAIFWADFSLSRALHGPTQPKTEQSPRLR